MSERRSQIDKSNMVAGQRDGGSIKLRLPPKAVVNTGATISSFDALTQEQVTLTRGTQWNVNMAFTSEELSQQLDDFSQYVLTPYVDTLASYIDYSAMTMTKEVANSVGTPGTTPSTALVALQANQKMSEFATPVTQRVIGVNPAANASFIDGLKGLFNSSDKVGAQYKQGTMGANTLGYDEWFMTQSVYTHTTGSGASGLPWKIDEGSGTNLVEGTRIVDMDEAGGSSSATMAVGDVFTIDGVYACNPETKQSTGSLMQFVVTNAATASSSPITGGTGTGQLQFWPAIYSAASGGLQNVVGATLAAAGFINDADVTIIGTASTPYPQNIAFHKKAFVFATTDLIMPQGVDFAAREVVDGISIRVVRQYRIGTDDIPCRCDVLGGYKTRQPEMACRIWG